MNSIRAAGAVSNLLNYSQRVGDTARPESIPYFVDLSTLIAGKHRKGVTS